MDGLKQLWLDEGDLGKLLNDKRSLKGLSGFKVKKPPESLLNSQRMYWKLLDALAQMDRSGGGSVYFRDATTTPSPLLSELDLFITTSDIEGLPLPIALWDRVVFERRYKNVFHFRYSADASDTRNDFIAKNDPFLAFAARCTSSFPFAFEPTCLKESIEIAQNHPRYFGSKNLLPEWDRFFSEYLRAGLFDLDRDCRGEVISGELPNRKMSNATEKATADLRDSFMGRAFGDGGYFDNKPFTYATATLIRRAACYETNRKLLYVEPSPEHPELLRSNSATPDFLENVRAAVLDLPRQETIREDIGRLQERNRVLSRLVTYAQEVDADMAGRPLEPMDVEQFYNGYVEDTVAKYGVGYGPYHRLVVGEITSFLAEIVSRAKGHDPDSNAGTAIRELVAAWRRATYSIRPEFGKKSENEFLFNFDLHYRFRRVVFLIRRAVTFLRLDPLSESDENERLKALLRISLEHVRRNPERELAGEIDIPFANLIEFWLGLKDPGAIATSDAPRLTGWFKGFCQETSTHQARNLYPRLERPATDGARIA